MVVSTMQNRFIYLFYALLLNVTSLVGQSEISAQNKTHFFCIAPSIQTNGFGINFKWGHASPATKTNFYSFAIDKIRHQKEFRYIGNGRYNGFVYGRKNVAIPMKFGFGKATILGVRNSKNDVGVSWAYHIGASIAMLKPVYLYVEENPGSLIRNEKLVKYTGENTLDLENIIGGAPFFVGLHQMKFVPGAYGKLAMIFNWGKYYTDYHSLEIGFLTEIYAKELPLMASTQNSFIYPSFYLNWNLGKYW